MRLKICVLLLEVLILVLALLRAGLIVECNKDGCIFKLNPSQQVFVSPPASSPTPTVPTPTVTALPTVTPLNVLPIPVPPTCRRTGTLVPPPFRTSRTLQGSVAACTYQVFTMRPTKGRTLFIRLETFKGDADLYIFLATNWKVQFGKSIYKGLAVDELVWAANGEQIDICVYGNLDSDFLLEIEER